MQIHELTLFTTNLEAQKVFYTTVLELPLLFLDSEKFTVQMGVSRLTFKKSNYAKPAHFAINISSYKIQEALLWMQKRTEILLCEGKPIADFSNWNADALYFYDADENIVEFIARNDLNIVNTHPFSASDLLSISEIGIPCDDIKFVYDQLNAMRSIEIYDGNFERFCALGNAEGLFILVHKHKKKWFPTNEKIETADFSVKGDYNFAFSNGIIVVEKS